MISDLNQRFEQKEKVRVVRVLISVQNAFYSSEFSTEYSPNNPKGKKLRRILKQQHEDMKLHL